MAVRASSRRMHIRARLLVLSLLAAIELPGCLVEQGRCGPNQERNIADNCVCKSGFVVDANLICQPCAASEISVGDKCVCAPGFTRDSSSQQCIEVVADVGKPCLTDADCPAGGPYCHHAKSGESYCTVTGCTQLTECPFGYGCDLKAMPTVCARAPTGLFAECQTQQDCAGKEASFCETSVSYLCTVPNCKNDGDCFTGLECCDVTAYGLPTICVQEGLCPFE